MIAPPFDRCPACQGHARRLVFARDAFGRKGYSMAPCGVCRGTGRRSAMGGRS